MKKQGIIRILVAIMVSMLCIGLCGCLEVQPDPTIPPITNPTEPEATEPEATEPEATEPEATEPEATEPEATEPEATEPEATEPEATEPEATEPEATEPEATEPEATEPEATEPEATEPEATEPEATEPEATEPEATEPEATEPEATEPEATEPEVTEPEATEPEATEPEATEPEDESNAISMPETGMNHWFKFDSGTDVGADAMESYSGVTATATIVDGGADGNGCLYLDGTTSVNFGKDGNMNKPFTTRTISFWFRADSYDGNQIILDNGGASNGVGVRIYNGALEVGIASGKAGAFVRKKISFDLSAYEVGQWIHIALVISGTDFDLYVDGRNVGSAKITGIVNGSEYSYEGVVTSAANPSELGANTGKNNAFNDNTVTNFIGCVDDLRYYESAVVPVLGNNAE